MKYKQRSLMVINDYYGSQSGQVMSAYFTCNEYNKTTVVTEKWNEVEK